MFQIKTFLLFADDTNIVIKGDNLNDLNSIINEELTKLYVWFRANRLSLNVKRTNYIVFHCKQKKYTPNPMNIYINGSLINEVAKTTFLGIIVDNVSSWKYHLDHTCKRISKSFYLIAKASKVMDTKSLFQLYYSFVYSYIQYDIVVWGTANAIILNKIIVLQKKIMRIICGIRGDILLHY